MLKKIIFAVAILGILFLGHNALEKPRLDRNWAVDQAVPATSVINGDEITIKNIRNFTYRSTTDYTPSYYDAKVKLSELQTVDYIVEPFGDIGAAHTFLSFGFVDGRQLAVSVEIRKEQGETFSALKGVANQYELVYVIADERDVIDLRVNHRKHTVLLYPTLATPEQAQQLFVNMLSRANQLLEQPEFYHTVLSNCTTNIARHVNEITPQKIGIDYRLILPEYSDILAQEIGLIAPDMTIEVARERYKINQQAELYQGDPDFSRLIREEVVSTEVSAIVPDPLSVAEYRVVKVIDGDTIDVLVGTEQKRVRYIGIDTPEAYPPEKAECLATEATNRNKSLVEGGLVRLVKDNRDVDDFGRLLRYVYVGEQMVNEVLLREGLAKAVVFPPDTKHAKNFAQVQRAAQTEAIGVWGGLCQ